MRTSTVGNVLTTTPLPVAAAKDSSGKRSSLIGSQAAGDQPLKKIDDLISKTSPSLWMSQLDPDWKKTPAGKLEIAWLELTQTWKPEYSARYALKIKRLCRKGVPEKLRGDVWKCLAGASFYKDKHESNYYESLLEMPANPMFEVIDRDVHRCYPGHPMFAEKSGDGQKFLRNVLRAYAQHNPELGYCQGMGMLAGGFLMHMAEEDAFWLLVAVIDRYLKGYFEADMVQVRVDSLAFQALIAPKVSKKLARHLASQGVEAIMFTAQWFLVLYSMVLPLPTVKRVWDVFFSEGAKVLFRVGLALLRQAKDTILYGCPSIAETMQYLLHMPPSAIDTERLLSRAFSINLSRYGVMKLQRDCARKIFQIGKNHPKAATIASGTAIRPLQ